MSSPSAFRTAASSTSLNAPGSVAIGLKKSAISESSPDIDSLRSVIHPLVSNPAQRLNDRPPALFVPTLATHKLVAAKTAADLVEHSIHHAGLIAIDKCIRDIDIFRDHNPARNVLAMLELIGARTQHRAQNGVDALQRPAL